MNRTPGGPRSLDRDGKLADRPTRSLLLGGLILLTLLATLTALSTPYGIASPPLAAPLGGSHSGAAPMAVTQSGGDLTVATGTSVSIGPATGQLTYYEGGNLSVEAGGTLTVRNTTLVFVQFIGNAGPGSDPFAHIFQLNDAGTIVLENSSITTFVTTVDPYPDLSVTITGVFDMRGGVLAFPGSITVSGASASLSISHGIVEGNPAVSEILANATANTTSPSAMAFVGANQYAPTLDVTGGAKANFFASTLSDSFKDVLNASSLPGVPPSSGTPAPGNNVLGATALPPIILPGPPATPDSLALAATFWTVTSGTLSVSYNATAASSSSNSAFKIGTSSYGFGAIGFAATGTGLASVQVPLPNGAVGAIDQMGVPAYLQAVLTGQVAVVLGAATTPVTIHSITVSFVAPWNFNLTVAGSGSTLTAADTTFDENWNATPGLGGAPTYVPWQSNKIVLTGGAQAFLANVSVPYPVPIDYAHQSIVVPDASSSVAFYRWLEVPVRGAGGIVVQGATVVAPYAYSGNASENATVTALNALATADPTLAEYVAQWDAAAGVASYGEVDAAGNATLLLATGTLSGPSLPDGSFLGDYHVGVTTNPGGQGTTQWFDASLPAYPAQMLPSGPNGTAPVVTSSVVFPQYRVTVTPTTPTFLVGGQAVTNGSTAVGQNLTISETVQNTGTGTVSSYSARLLVSVGGKTPVQIAPNQTFSSLGPGASHQIRFDWTVNGTVVGYSANGILATFTIGIAWDPGAGAVNATTSLTIFPPYIAFSTNGLSGTLLVGNSYVLHALVNYDGNGSALLNVSAQSASGGYVSVASRLVIRPGETNVTLFVESALQPGTYSLTASVFHDGRTVWQNTTNAFVIPSPTTSTSTPWYDTTFVGLALWLWIVIAAAIAAGIGLFLFFTVQRAKGKVVECGECGAMIPETAAACPECGAEFESDRVRCSRCGSTIPGTAAVCPECAATLLGRAGAEKDDPERQGYADFVERFRAEGRKALGDSYSESAFWDWWKRQSTYVPFGQWKMQQAQGSRAGMTAPRESASTETPTGPRPPPPRGGAAPGRPPAAPKASVPPAAPAPTTSAPTPPPEASAPAPGLITCANCHKEIPATYLVCPFCGAVTQ